MLNLKGPPELKSQSHCERAVVAVESVKLSPSGIAFQDPQALAAAQDLKHRNQEQVAGGMQRPRRMCTS
jgi:hypothetical protein